MPQLIIVLVLSLASLVSAQEFQTPTDLVLDHGNPFDDPNFRNELETPQGICAPSFVLVQGTLNSSPICGPFDFFQNPVSHYVGCYQSLELSKNSANSCADHASQLAIENDSLKARLIQCKKSRGRRC